MTELDPNTTELFDQGSWRTYTTADGLAGLQVEHVAGDGQGHLWFATCTSGVSRFDGERFQTFTTRNGLCGNQVYALHLGSWRSSVDRHARRRGVLVRRRAFSSGSGV